MPLPLPYVKRIHTRLMVRYGSAWLTKWAGVDQEEIQKDWAQQLDGMSKEGILAALSNLPDEFPPTATAFRKLCETGHRSPDARDVLRLMDERGGTRPPPEVLARLKAISGSAARNVTQELSHD